MSYYFETLECLEKITKEKYSTKETIIHWWLVCELDLQRLTLLQHRRIIARYYIQSLGRATSWLQGVLTDYAQFLASAFASMLFSTVQSTKKSTIPNFDNLYVFFDFMLRSDSTSPTRRSLFPGKTTNMKWKVTKDCHEKILSLGVLHT